jgi:hypothetical protein
MKLRRRAAVAIVIALLAAGTVALLAPAGPAVAFSSGGLFLDVQVESPARLVARGAAVDVPLEVTCNAPEPVEVFVTVTQRVGKGVAAGSGFASFGCTGGGQDVVVRVTANPSGSAFVRGRVAVVEARCSAAGPTSAAPRPIRRRSRSPAEPSPSGRGHVKTRPLGACLRRVGILGSIPPPCSSRPLTPLAPDR